MPELNLNMKARVVVSWRMATDRRPLMVHGSGVQL